MQRFGIQNEAKAKEDYVHVSKKMRTDVCSNAIDSTTDKNCDSDQSGDRDNLFKTFENFEVQRVLSNSEDHKSIAVVGNLKGKEGNAVVMLKKLAFNAEKLEEIFSGKTETKTLFRNDIYYNSTAWMPRELNELGATIIYPAQEKHILKYEKQASSFVYETPELYKEVTKPFIESASFSKEWIYNILEHKKEEDRIVFEDPDPELGFILLPDMKWTGEQMEDLYLQAIVRRRDLTSIRDLRGNHIPLLKNIMKKGTEAIMEKYGIPAHKLRIYVHYLPTFYHLHVHFTALSFDAPGTWVGKAIALSTVISNLNLRSDHYELAELAFMLKDNHPLHAKFEEKGCFSG